MFFCDIILRCVSSALAFWLIHQLPVWQPFNSSSVGGGGGIPNIQDEISEERGRERTHVSGLPAELSYRCYDLSSCLFPLVFSVSRFPFALGALGDFIVLFSLFFISSFFSIWVVIFVILSSWWFRACVCVYPSEWGQVAPSVYALILVGVGGRSGCVGQSGLAQISILDSQSHQYAAQWAVCVNLP